MRISWIQGDSGYNTWQSIDKAVVYLDGKEIEHYLTADETLGMVLTFDRDVNGHYYYKEHTEELATKKLYGRVEIVFKE